ncbi:DUF4232 domain-containing protein [Streptomyces sp. CA-288835]|uniref:DUF4232 domain-containing protein n=1 Tax=Streptomyces sp. CA-288835 TaxID=3240069 RepID=UPI003D8DB216
MIAIRRRSSPYAAVLVCLLALSASGCGLSAELERERNPDPGPRPSSTPPAVSAAPVPESSASVPVQAAGGCPSSGVRLGTGLINGAMGLRGMTLTLTNCGERPFELNGYPSVTVLDEAGEPFPDVRTVEGTDQVPMASGGPGPEPLTLAPGETAQAGLVWRMHAEDGVYLRVTPQKGHETVTVRPEQALDIGPDNVLGTSPWKPME